MVIGWLAFHEEESYQEYLHRAPTPDLRITHLRGSEDIRKFMVIREKQKKIEKKCLEINDVDEELSGEYIDEE